VAFPSTHLAVRVEVALGADLTASPSTWAWTNATSLGLIRATAPISITRGAYDGALQSPPSTCTFTVDNTDGRWVPSNPNGAWYGQIGRGTPVRVVVNEGSESVRWTGFLTSLPPRWNAKEDDRYVKVTASGILQRLERGATPLRSAMVRELTTTTAGAPIAYWPGEDGSNATSIAEYFGGRAMELTGQVVTMAADGPPGSLPLPEFTTVSGTRGRVPSRPSTGEWTVCQVFQFPATPSAQTIILRWSTTGSLPYWDVTLTPGSPDTITLRAFDATGTQQITSSTSFLNLDDGSEAYGVWLLLAVAVSQDGTSLDYEWIYANATSSTGDSGTVATQTSGSVNTIGVHANTKSDGMHAGHWGVWDVNIQPSVVEPDTYALDGWSGFYASMRADRLGTEEGLPVDVATQSSDPATLMGPQPVGTFLDLLRECETASAGRLFEHMDPTDSDTYFKFRHSDDFTNVDAVLTLNHDSGHLAQPFEPTDDDQNLINDVTATRSGATGTGSSARVVATAGEHPAGLIPSAVGTYATSLSVNVELDEYLIHHAGWRVNLGTVEGLRFPVVTINFARVPSLIANWITCDIGSRITITNPPDGIPPDSIDLFIEGWTEILHPRYWQVELNCSPYGPWHGFRLAETSSDTNVYLGRLAEDPDCALRIAVDSDDTSFVFDPNFTRWTNAADDFPVDVRIGGEVCTVSSIANGSASYVAAGAASHADNAAVSPALYAGHSTRHIIFVLAAIRSSGTGTLATPTDYTRLPVFAEADNVQLFAKVHDGSEAAPTVTPSGGSAGDTVSAFTFGWTNISNTVDLGDLIVENVAMLNASAQNIAYGGVLAKSWCFPCLNLIVGWKQDDYTSIAVPTGFTEILEASTTTGSDQSLYAAYRLDSSRTVVVEGSLAVTGGASAISRSAVMCIPAGVQTMTVSARSVNGVVKSHAVGAKIAVDDAAVLAL
jgi:hypothetical protein